MVEYDEALSKATERTYLMPPIVQQRAETMAAIQLRAGESVLDIGCGMGLLARDMALAVGATGAVHGVDNSGPMIALAKNRCADFPQIKLSQASADALADDELYDVVTCTQVLLYVNDPADTIGRMYRALKPGGRIAIIETDWRGVVFNALDHNLTRLFLDSWEAELPSPHLPSKLQGLLRQAGFTAVRVQAIPIIETSYHPDGYSVGMVIEPRDKLMKQGKITAAQADAYLDYLKEESSRGNYFFCLNRFLFTAVK